MSFVETYEIIEDRLPISNNHCTEYLCKIQLSQNIILLAVLNNL